MRNEFIKHAARAFFASAWADLVEENGHSLRGEIMEQMPRQTDPAALHAANTLAMDMERANKCTIEELMSHIEDHGEGDRPNTPEYFGHYAAMQAMGHGVGLYDAFGRFIYDSVSVPYVEFGMHSLECDYE